MDKFNHFFRWSWTFLVAVTLTLGLAGCDGDDGATGSQGTAGTDGNPGDPGQACWDLNNDGVGNLPDEDINGDGVVDVVDCGGAGADPVAAAVDAAQPESCATCHDDVGQEKHQSLYESYIDASAFTMTLTSFTTVPGVVAGTFDGTLELTILKDGVPFTDYDALNEKTFIVVDYDSVNNQYLAGRQYLGDPGRGGTVTMVAPGDYVLTGTGLSFDPAVNGTVYGYIAQTPLFTKIGEIGAEIPTGSHVELFDDVANAALAFGDSQVSDPDAYASVANVGGCVKCHGEPYLKHGFRAAEVAGLPDFAACKTCHYSGRNGFLSSLQYMVDDPFSWATGVAAPAGLYTYEGSIMNDTHMAHAMEFPYPQSMANCSTCHGTLLDDAGVVIPGTDKLAQALDDSNFTAETCKSCHAIQGIDAWPEYVDAMGVEQDEGKYYQGRRAPALEYLWTPAGGYDASDLSFHDSVIDSAAPDACTLCHGAAGVARAFNAIHTGYDPTIYDATGTKYAETYTVAVDAITWNDVDSTLKIDFSASDPAVGIVPEVLLSFYGWDSKNFIVPSHQRDGSDRCPSRRGDGCRFEFGPGDTNPLFSDFAETAPGVWTVTANLAEFLPLDPVVSDDILSLDIPTLIANGTIKNAEVAVLPTLNLGGNDVVLLAADATFDLNAGMEVPGDFKGDNSTVDIVKCNACHDALASPFHDGDGRAGDGIETCKHCHNPTFDGGHIEMTSRSIDSYVHAIHTFQDFDLDDKFEAFDPVFSKRYDQHINHVFPNFTIRNCEACHKDGTVAVTYNVPDQSKSIPGVQSASWDLLTWYEIVGGAAEEDTAGRNIGTVPIAVTGPASRACGACHRGRLINDDAPGELASFNAHVEAFGTYVENAEEDDAITFGIIDKIMSMFE